MAKLGETADKELRSEQDSGVDIRLDAENEVDLDNISKVHNMILRRNKFYRKSFRFLILVLLLSILSLFCLIFESLYLTTENKKAWYIPTSLNGTVIKAENLKSNISNDKVITDQDVINWVQKIIPYIYNFNFLDSTDNFRTMIGYFNPDGYKAYKYAIETESQTLVTIKAKNYVAQGYGCGSNTVQVISSGVQSVQGYPVYTWRLRMPMVAKYVSSVDYLTMRAYLNVDVQRVPTFTFSEGIALYSFVITDQEFIVDNSDVDKLCATLFKT